MKNQKIVRAVVLGGGAVAQRRHLPEYAMNPNAEIAGILDFNQQRAQELCERYGGKAYASLDQVLADESVDAVSVCTPNVTHAEYTIKALEAGNIHHPHPLLPCIPNRVCSPARGAGKVRDTHAAVVHQMPVALVHTTSAIRLASINRLVSCTHDLLISGKDHPRAL